MRWFRLACRFAALAVLFAGSVRGCGRADAAPCVFDARARLRRRAEEGVRGRQPRHRDRLAARLDRGDHGPPPGRARRARRRHLGPRRDLDDAAQEGGAAQAARAAEPCRDSPEFPRCRDTAGLGRHGGVGGGGLLQHRRGREARAAEARCPGTTSSTRASAAGSPCRTRAPPAPAISTSRPGSSSSARRRRGGSWTACIRISRPTSIPARSPAANAAAGEFPVGISYELAGAQAKEKGAPVDVLLMKEGGGWDMDAAGILLRHPEPRRRPPPRRFRGEPQGERDLCPLHPAGGDRGHREADPVLPGRGRRLDDQERPRLGVGKPRAHRRRMGAAIWQEVRGTPLPAAGRGERRLYFGAAFDS